MTTVGQAVCKAPRGKMPVVLADPRLICFSESWIYIKKKEIKRKEFPKIEGQSNMG
jgi:hypothetical protein